MALRPALQNFVARVGPAISAAWLNWVDQKSRELVSVKDYDALCNGTTDDTAAFQAAVTAAASGITRIYVPATSNVTGTVTAGAGTVVWVFEQGAVIVGGGTLPFYNQAMTYNSTPNYGERVQAFHGTTANPTTDGTVSSNYFQRVDASVTADSPSSLISNIYATFKRLAAGRGWLYGVYSYVEDASDSGAAQSVGAAGVAHATGAANTAVWGLYGEAHARGSGTIATGAEFNCYNYSGASYTYVDANPVTYPFTMGSWVLGAGDYKNTIGYGIGSAGNSSALTNSFRAGMFMQTYSVSTYGIDIQAMPMTGIRFKNGASTDGSHTTPGGIGIDFGASASYSTGSLNIQNQGALHLRGHAICFGSDGLGHAYYDGAGKFQFNYNGTNCGYINAAGADIQLNGDIAPGVVAGAGATSSTISAAFGAVIVTVTGGTTTLTLPSAATYSGKCITIKNGSSAPGTTVSATSNITQLDNQTTTTAILAATAGKWAILQSNGTNWIIMAAN